MQIEGTSIICFQFSLCGCWVGWINDANGFMNKLLDKFPEWSFGLELNGIQVMVLKPTEGMNRNICVDFC